MQAIRLGVRDARWPLLFGCYLLPAITVAALLAYAIQGRVMTPPSPLTWVFTAIAAVIAFCWSGIKDGPSGRIGRFFWTVIALFVVVALIKHLGRTREHGGETLESQAGRTKQITLAGHCVSVSLGAVEPEPSTENEPPTGLSLRDLRISWREAHLPV